MKAPEIVQEIANAVGGTINECQALPDGSGFATMSFPLPKDHWIYETTEEGFTAPPPMPFRLGQNEHAVLARFPAGPYPHRQDRMTREEFAQKIRAAGKYAIKASTMRGKEMDFDPDAMLQNLIVGMLGYWTDDGLSSDGWDNPETAT